MSFSSQRPCLIRGSDAPDNAPRKTAILDLVRHPAPGVAVAVVPEASLRWKPRGACGQPRRESPFSRHHFARGSLTQCSGQFAVAQGPIPHCVLNCSRYRSLPGAGGAALVQPAVRDYREVAAASVGQQPRPAGPIRCSRLKEQLALRETATDPQLASALLFDNGAACAMTRPLP